MGTEWPLPTHYGYLFPDVMECSPHAAFFVPPFYGRHCLKRIECWNSTHEESWQIRHDWEACNPSRIAEAGELRSLPAPTSRYIERPE